MVLFFVILALVFVLVLVIVSNIVIVPQSKVYVIERLGSYSDTWTAGLHVKIPFIERIAKKVSLKEQVADFPPQPVITRDNVTMQIDTVVFFQVMDAKLYTYGVNQPIAAIESLSATTLRNIIGEMELDHTLTSRDVINGKITAILDEATDKAQRRAMASRAAFFSAAPATQGRGRRCFAARPWVSNAVIVGIPPSKIRIKNHLSPVPFSGQGGAKGLCDKAGPHPRR